MSIGMMSMMVEFIFQFSSLMI